MCHWAIPGCRGLSGVGRGSEYMPLCQFDRYRTSPLRYGASQVFDEKGSPVNTVDGIIDARVPFLHDQ